MPGSNLTLYEKWGGNTNNDSGYTQENVEGVDNTKPWTFNIDSNKCKINCKKGYFLPDNLD